ncbi:MAG TPA: hypothetical protein P5287_03715, partial [bacterium]|nr:hypothetical protein [bacterium]
RRDGTGRSGKRAPARRSRRETAGKTGRLRIAVHRLSLLQERKRAREKNDSGGDRSDNVKAVKNRREGDRSEGDQLQEG